VRSIIVKVHQKAGSPF